MPCLTQFALTLISFSFLVLFILPSFVQSASGDPPIFKFVNEGALGHHLGMGDRLWPTENGATYRVTGIGAHPFELLLYNTTPNAFTLAIILGPWGGPEHPHEIRRWVWEANLGKPVQDGATLRLTGDGNLELANVDGRIVWQTFTSNKNVTKLELQNNGNLVLVDATGRYVWQSFYYPTDTLLLGQSLLPKGVRSLVSQSSNTKKVNGPYRLVLEPSRLVLTYQSKKSVQPIIYYKFAEFYEKTFTGVTFHGDENGRYLDLRPTILSQWGPNWVTTKYDSKYSFLRLGADGNLRIFTFDIYADVGSFDVAFTLFTNPNEPLIGSVQYPRLESQCQLPEKCGDFGLCEDNQCVACPTPSGLMGWSKDCKQPEINSCDAKDFHYYKIEGVDHFMSKYNEGMSPVEEDNCRDKCTQDCKCLGYFYHQESSSCWIAHDLKTLTKTSNMAHVAYIKTPNK